MFSVSARPFALKNIMSMKYTNAIHSRNASSINGNMTCFDDVIIPHNWHELRSISNLRLNGSVGSPKYW